MIKKRLPDIPLLKLTAILLLLLLPTATTDGKRPIATADSPIETGAEQVDVWLPLLRGKRVGVTANHTSIIGTRHLVDVLLAKGINVVRIFAPEHGFRGIADAGEHFAITTDAATGIEIVSLYGRHVKPLPVQLQGLDCMLFDIQDVGVRFYTYLSTMHYVMESCAENSLPLVVLDRPNPNGFYVDGPVLESNYRSFVGMHPIPIVHGMTLGELAGMINGEGWLRGGVSCRLTVVPCTGYTHQMRYRLPVGPSPNLPTMQAVYLYPSLCLFEGTVVSVGRGTDTPFEVFGHPSFQSCYSFSFTPASRPGAQRPPFMDTPCFGVDLQHFPIHEPVNHGQLLLQWLIDARQCYSSQTAFFTDFFYKLCGTDRIRQQIEQGMSAADIRASWQQEVETFKALRAKYLLYL
ncbi:MAG: DUF1343 domain-containing protein [Prevotellaceae bacterium]|jgi:uncharacterized protein YbbC (DUF1343 family)|nr:DUF1343 domain-containing protein [Prevotellaceae bacterium]